MIKIIEERDTQKNPKKQRNTIKQNKERKEQRCDTTYRERVRPNWFCCAFKLGFLQLICKSSLIFKSKVRWALSINLKERGWYESKHVVVECRCLETWDFLSFLMFLNPMLSI